LTFRSGSPTVTDDHHHRGLTILEDPFRSTMSATVVSADALDLLVTAALRYGVLASRTRNAFSPTTAGVLQATPDDAGRVLLAQHLAAQHPTLAAPPPLSSELRCYQHVPVVHIEPVHVLKAIHTYEAVAAASPGWDTSAAHTLTTALLRAAVKALPGYAEAPSSWRRPLVRSGPPIGLARQWRPVRDGVTWMTSRESWPTGSPRPSCCSPSTRCPTCPVTCPPGTGFTSSRTVTSALPPGRRSPSRPHC